MSADLEFESRIRYIGHDPIHIGIRRLFIIKVVGGGSDKKNG
jgi:hypothetical protein